MKVALFDGHREALSFWDEVGRPFSLDISQFREPADLPCVEQGYGIIILDEQVFAERLLSAAAELCRTRPHQAFVVSGEHLSTSRTVQLMQAGVAWVFLKPLDQVEIMGALPRLVESADKKASQASEFAELHSLLSKLTAREKDVLNCVLSGIPNKVAATDLKVSIRTIESRRAKVYRKLGAANVVELVRKVDRYLALSKIYAVEEEINLPKLSMRSPVIDRTAPPRPERPHFTKKPSFASQFSANAVVQNSEFLGGQSFGFE